MAFLSISYDVIKDLTFMGSWSESKDAIENAKSINADLVVKVVDCQPVKIVWEREDK